MNSYQFIFSTLDDIPELILPMFFYFAETFTIDISCYFCNNNFLLGLFLHIVCTDLT